MNKVKIKRVKRNKKKITVKEKILTGIGVGGSLAGGIAGVAGKPAGQTAIVSAAGSEQANITSKIKDTLSRVFTGIAENTVAPKTAKAYTDASGGYQQEDNADNSGETFDPASYQDVDNADAEPTVSDQTTDPTAGPTDNQGDSQIFYQDSDNSDTEPGQQDTQATYPLAPTVPSSTDQGQQAPEISTSDVLSFGDSASLPVAANNTTAAAYTAAIGQAVQQSAQNNSVLDFSTGVNAAASPYDAGQNPSQPSASSSIQQVQKNPQDIKNDYIAALRLNGWKVDQNGDGGWHLTNTASGEVEDITDDTMLARAQQQDGSPDSAMPGNNEQASFENDIYAPGVAAAFTPQSPTPGTSTTPQATQQQILEQSDLQATAVTEAQDAANAQAAEQEAAQQQTDAQAENLQDETAQQESDLQTSQTTDTTAAPVANIADNIVPPDAEDYNNANSILNSTAPATIAPAASASSLDANNPYTPENLAQSYLNPEAPFSVAPTSRLFTNDQGVSVHQTMMNGGWTDTPENGDTIVQSSGNKYVYQNGTFLPSDENPGAPAFGDAFSLSHGYIGPTPITASADVNTQADQTGQTAATGLVGSHPLTDGSSINVSNLGNGSYQVAVIGKDGTEAWSYTGTASQAQSTINSASPVTPVAAGNAASAPLGVDPASQLGEALDGGNLNDNVIVPGSINATPSATSATAPAPGSTDVNPPDAEDLYFNLNNNISAPSNTPVSAPLAASAVPQVMGPTPITNTAELAGVGLPGNIQQIISDTQPAPVASNADPALNGVSNLSPVAAEAQDGTLLYTNSEGQLVSKAGVIYDYSGQSQPVPVSQLVYSGLNNAVPADAAPTGQETGIQTKNIIDSLGNFGYSVTSNNDGTFTVTTTASDGTTTAPTVQTLADLSATLNSAQSAYDAQSASAETAANSIVVVPSDSAPSTKTGVSAGVANAEQGVAGLGAKIGNDLKNLVVKNTDPNVYQGADNKDGTVTVTDNGNGIVGVNGKQNILYSEGWPKGLYSDANGYVYAQTAAGQYTYIGLNVSQMDPTLASDKSTGLFGLDGSPLTSIGQGVYKDANNNIYVTDQDGQAVAAGLKAVPNAQGGLTTDGDGVLNVVNNTAAISLEAGIDSKVDTAVTALTTGKLNLNVSVGADGLVHISGTDWNDLNGGDITMSKQAFASNVIDVNTAGLSKGNDFKTVLNLGLAALTGGSSLATTLGLGGSGTPSVSQTPVILYNDKTGESVIISPQLGLVDFMNSDGSTQSELTQSQLKTLLTTGQTVNGSGGTVSLSSLSDWLPQTQNKTGLAGFAQKAKNTAQNIAAGVAPTLVSKTNPTATILQQWSGAAAAGKSGSRTDALGNPVSGKNR